MDYLGITRFVQNSFVVNDKEFSHKTLKFLGSNYFVSSLNHCGENFMDIHVYLKKV